MMITVDLSIEASAEVARLTNARVFADASTPPLDEAPLIGIIRRNAVRRALGRRILLLWRVACEEADGRIVESALVAITVDVGDARFDARRVSWSGASLLAFVRSQRAAWRDSANDNIHRFTASREARDRAIAAAGATQTKRFQAGLFDRRADRAQLAQVADEAALAAQLAARTKAVAAAGAVTFRDPELLLVLIPRPC
jgi:hypothetical protein